jgi:hypothetical protein
VEKLYEATASIFGRKEGVNGVMMDSVTGLEAALGLALM